MASGFSLKDQLFNAEKVAYLGGLFRAQNPGFDPDFEKRVMARLLDLELKERIAWIAECLETALPMAFDEAAAVIESALPPPLDPSLNDDDFGDFIFAPLGEYAARQGLEPDPTRGLSLIEAITQRFSMEWALRLFLNRWPEATLARLSDWTAHENYHVRRLVSEGTRPRLPWGMAVDLPINAALPLLDQLHADPTRYVTRSVANHLNDIAKKDLELVCDRLEHWAGQGAQATDELRWMTGHALRTAVKQGAPRAMRLLGYAPDAPVKVTAFDVPDTARIGDTLEFSLTLESPKSTPVLVDYLLHVTKANGQLAPKVFKLKQGEISADRPLVLNKRHKLHGNATTFTLRPGPARLEVQVNGRVLAARDLTLLA